MKKVLFLTNYPAPYRVSFFSELGKLCDLTVLFEERPEEQKHRDSLWFNNNYENFDAAFLKEKTIFRKRYCPEVIEWIRKKYDIVLVGMYSTLTAQRAIIYMKRHNIPFVIETDGGYIKTENIVVRYWKRNLISSAQYWFSPSKLSDEYLKFYGADADRINRYPFTSLNAEDIRTNLSESSEKNKLRERLGLTGKYIILSIGQFIHRKGIDVLLYSVPKMNPNIQLVIVGGEPTEEYLRICREIDAEKVKFEGFKTKSELSLYYMAADIFVLPTREDIWGLVINEAMAYGLPIVSTDKCIAALELIENGVNGYIVPSEDPDAIAERVNILVGNEEIRLAQGQAALLRIKEYSIENMAKVHTEMFESF